MLPQPTPSPTDDPADTPDPADDDAQFEQALFRCVLEVGMDVARMVQAVAKPYANPDPAAPAPEPPTTAQAAQIAAAYDRVARAIRRTILLKRRVDDPPPRAQHRESSRRQIIRAVEDVIQRSERRPADKDHLETEFHERLDGPDLEDDIDSRPIPDIIAEICRDLGLATPSGATPWKRRTPEDIATLCARAAAPRPARPAPPAS